MTEQVVLVDFENVREFDLTQLPAHACIKVFAGESQSKLPMDLVEGALKLGSRFELVRIKGNGPNALDFHIACHLGEGICKYPKAEFVILSNDKGFDSLVRHLVARGFKCRRNGQARATPAPRAPLPVHAQAVAELLRSLDKDKRPSKLAKLINLLATHFKKKMTLGEIKQAVEHLQEAGLIAGTESALTYNL